MLALGTKLPRFSLSDVITGKSISDGDVRGPKGTLVMFICNHCPFVKHVLAEIGRVGSEARAKGFGVVAISSNDAKAYPEDAPDKMAALARAESWSFPYLHDASQETAKAFEAACTPDFYLFDANGALVYRGQLDDSRPGSDVPVTGRDLRAAIDALVSGRTPSTDQKASIGCNIKWTPGNEPAWFGPAR
jgi:hypothetical protein